MGMEFGVLNFCFWESGWYRKLALKSFELQTFCQCILRVNNRSDTVNVLNIANE
jgi:hypothetical protein